MVNFHREGIEARTDLDRLFAALGNGHRREIVHQLGLQPSPISRLAAARGLSLPAMTKHVHVLEAAGLVTRRKLGRTTFLALERAGHPRPAGLARASSMRTGAPADETLENYERPPTGDSTAERGGPMKFLVLFHDTWEPKPEIQQAWQAWFAKVGDRFVDSGNPFTGGRRGHARGFARAVRGRWGRDRLLDHLRRQPRGGRGPARGLPVRRRASGSTKPRPCTSWPDAARGSWTHAREPERRSTEGSSSGTSRAARIARKTSTTMAARSASGDGGVQQRVDEQVDLVAALGRGELGPRGRGDVPEFVVEEPGQIVVDQAGFDLPRLRRLQRGADLEHRRARRSAAAGSARSPACRPARRR